MKSILIKGAAVPEFDKYIDTWLQKASGADRDPASPVVTIGVRNQERRIYREIRAYGTEQHLDTIAFFDKAGFSKLPVEFAKETGFDYVFHHDGW